MEGLIVLAAGCMLQSADTRLRVTDEGFAERTRYELLVGPDGCPEVGFRLPPGVRLGPRDARLWLYDGRRRLGEERWLLSERGLDDRGTATLLLPEVERGDRVRVDLHRAWTGHDALVLRPGHDGAAWAEVQVQGEALLHAEGLTLEAARQRAWGADPSPEAALVVARAARLPPPLPDEAGELSAEAALARGAELVWLPRGVDGPHPVAGPAALARGAVDDRGFARTVGALAAEGPDQVEVGYLLQPPHGEQLLHEIAEVAVWWREGEPVPLLHPHHALPGGTVWTPSGVFPLAEVARTAPDPRAEQVQVDRRYEVRIHRADAQLALAPGGGSELGVHEALRFTPAPRARTWTVPLPPDPDELTIEVSPPDVPVSYRVRPDAVVLVIPPADDLVTVSLSWVQPDAPACGELLERPGEQVSLVVGGEGIRARLDPPFWRIVSWRGQPIVPSRELLVRALDRRFANASLPEPGLPQELRGHAPSWDLAEALRPALFERARPAALDLDPLWPRRLHRARGSGAVSSVEAALILRLYAQQARLPATWALARPAELGPGDPVCPVGYTEGLLRVGHGEGAQWIDAGCTACAPFELRPHLEGASAYGPGISRTPPPSEGRLEVHHRGDDLLVRLQGPPALLLRLELERVPPSGREDFLAARFGGDGSALVESEGLEEPGAPVVLRISPGPAPPDPLALPEPGLEGETWLVWVGDRLATSPLPASRRSLELDGLRYDRASDGDRTVERLTVRERRLEPSDREALLKARLAPDPEPPDLEAPADDDTLPEGSPAEGPDEGSPADP